MTMGAQYTILVWCGVMVAITCFLPGVHVPGKLRFRPYFVEYALMGAFVYLAICYLIGLIIKSIALSPYDISPSGVILNLLEVGAVVVGQEMLRAYAIGVVPKRSGKRWVWLLIITLVMALLQMNLSKVFVISSTYQWFVYIAGTVLPAIAQSMLLSVFVYYGGFPAGAVYLGCIHAFTRVFPFLPDLPWIAKSAVGILFPVLMALYIKDRYELMLCRHVWQKQMSVKGIGATLLLAVAFGWFVVGVFPIYPSVILTGSMRPLIAPGDVILIEKITKEAEVYQIQENDIITFKMDDIIVTHRIAEVLYDKAGNISFRTKGDNNKSMDEAVLQPNDIKGRVKNIIPKVGIPALLLHSADALPEGGIADGQVENEETSVGE